MSFYNSMIEKLTDLFNKTKESNIGKLFYVTAKQFDDLKSTLNTIDEWRDVDNARGLHLDKLGVEIVQEYRNGQTDEQYRLRIKTKIIANLSRGDIESINTVLDVYMGEHFLGLEEGWRDHKEPAALMANITGGIELFPFALAKRIKAGGVAFYVVYNPGTEEVLVIDGTYDFPVFYKECGEFSGEANVLPYEEENMEVVDDSYTFGVEYEVSEAHVEILEDEQKVEDDSYGFLVGYKACGELEIMSAGISAFEGSMSVEPTIYHFQVDYPECGEFVAEGE